MRLSEVSSLIKDQERNVIAEVITVVVWVDDHLGDGDVLGGVELRVNGGIPLPDTGHQLGHIATLDTVGRCQHDHVIDQRAYKPHNSVSKLNKPQLQPPQTNSLFPEVVFSRIATIQGNSPGKVFAAEVIRELILLINVVTVNYSDIIQPVCTFINSRDGIASATSLKVGHLSKGMDATDLVPTTVTRIYQTLSLIHNISSLGE